MALAHTPLEPTQLSPAAQRALAPGPARLMAARGLAPLPRPGDLISVLYQLALDSDPTIADAAAKSASELPERILSGALADASVDPRVLDYFAAAARNLPGLLQRIILNQSTANETIAELARFASSAEIDLIAQNEERLLQHPEIIGAMFHNSQGRMSTVDRALELAVRNGIRVPDVPSWDAMVKAIMGAGEPAEAAQDPETTDAAFADATDEPEDRPAEAADTEAKRENVPVSQMTIPQKIRIATLGNAVARATLIRDPNRLVALAAIKAPGVTDTEAGKYAGNHSLSDDVIKYISSRREWTKSYGVKLSLVQNPKTPIPFAIKLMPHLRERDLRTVSRSRGIPSAVVAQARKLLNQRRRGGPQK